MKIIDTLRHIIGAAALAGALLMPATAEAEQASKHDFTVVIDAGHGGHDTGAVDNKAREKDINLGVARKLAALIKKNQKDVNVVMTRDDDTFISLQERANIANRNKGDLFISVHTNSLDAKNPRRKSVQGTSVYALGLHKDDDNLRVAQRENSVIELEANHQEKYSGFDPNKDESYIIFEMSQKRDLANSLKFANSAQKQLVKTANRADRGVKQAGFWVLWATSMPAVLVELDFICNPVSAQYMTSEKGQEQLAQSLYNAFTEYYKSTTGKSGKAAVSKSSKSSGKSKTSGKKSKQRAELESEIEQTQQTLAQNVTELEDSEPTGPVVSKVIANKSERSHLKDTPTPSRRGITNTANGRRRRSVASKRASDSRDVATNEIALRSENDRLGEVEKKKEVVKQEPQPEPTKDKKNKKNKKGKKVNKKKDAPASEKKESKADKKKAKAPKESSKSKSSGGKTVIKVPTRTTVAKTSVQTSSSLASNKVSSKTAEAPHTYTILLLESSSDIATSDPSFGGLSPVSKQVEDGKYRYTYGQSTKRSAIVSMLNEVLPKVPGARIIMQ